MKRVFQILLLASLCFASTQAQAEGIKKFPGEAFTITWTNPTTDSTKVSGWRIKASPTSSGPYSFTGVSVTATARQAVIPVAFSTNSVMVFYVVCGYVTSGTTTLESDPSPAAGLEVDMNVVMPVGVQGK